MRTLGEILLALRNLVEIDVGRRQHLFDFDAGQLLDGQRVSVGVHAAANQQIAADFTAGRLGHRLVDAHFMQAGATLQMEVVQQIHDHIAAGGHEVHVPGCAIAVHRHGAAGARQERRCEPDVLHILERRAAEIDVLGRITGTIVQHRDAIADEFHMAEFFCRDGRHQAVERTQLRLAAKIEALEHVIVQGGHFAVLAAEQFLQGRAGIRIRCLRHRKLSLKLVYS